MHCVETKNSPLKAFALVRGLVLAGLLASTAGLALADNTGAKVPFVADREKIAVGSVHVAGAQPLKVDKADPAKSFWRDQVHYAFPVKYRVGKDSRGNSWEIGYMDEYRGSSNDPKVLVLIHGKGANAGYFSHLMKVALKSGLRVIAPDIPHYGKSIPGNVNKPLARSLQDTREAIHDVIVNQLGIKKATYLGHSLGGQWVTGYALTWPEAVDKLILEGSGGLEEYPTNLKLPAGTIPMFDPYYQYDLAKWKSVWDGIGHLKKEYAKDEEAIRLFYYFKQKDKDGKVVPAAAGYFLRNSPDASFLTDTRVEMIRGNAKEYDNYIITYIRDIYAMSIETRMEDPDSIYKRLKSLKMPIFLAYGDKEPFIPVASLSGRKDLKADVIRPFFQDMAGKGNLPVVKVYANAGHFIHTDFPQEFAEDCVRFALTNRVNKQTDPYDIMNWTRQ